MLSLVLLLCVVLSSSGLNTGLSLLVAYAAEQRGAPSVYDVGGDANPFLSDPYTVDDDADPILAYDITITYGEGLEFQPVEPISVTFAGDAVSAAIAGLEERENTKLQVYHIVTDPDSGETYAEPIDTEYDPEAGTITFEAEGFSVYGVGDTVDFEFNGHYFSIYGLESILLSELFGHLEMDIDLPDVADVTFTNYELISITKEGDDWRLTNLAPFDTYETLTIVLRDGTTVEVKVTDAANVCQIKDGNTMTGFVSLEAAFKALPGYPNVTAARTIELLSDCTVNSPIVFTGNADGRQITIKAADGVSNPTIYRGSVSGDLITLARGYMTVQDITIDGNSVSATGSLLKSTRNTNNLTLTNVTVQHHTASDDSCAVDANVIGNLNLNGGTKIIDNTITLMSSRVGRLSRKALSTTPIPSPATSSSRR